MRSLVVVALGSLSVACSPTPGSPDAGATSDASVVEADAGRLGADAGVDAGFDGGADGGTDAAVHDAGPFVPVRVQASLFWSDAGVVDDPQVVSFAKLMQLASSDDHGGRLFDDWFRRFASTAHSERPLPAQFVDEVARTQGADPSQWDLSRLPFVITGVHNRIDLASFDPPGHCGEFRVSAASTDPTLQPFHMLFLFRQPLEADDVVEGRITCEGTARRWAELSLLDEPALEGALRATFARFLTKERFLLIETVEQAASPWEWRQWVKTPGQGGLPFVFDNPALFQQVDVERVNASGATRDAFLSWVEANAAVLDARRLLVPETFRPPSVRAIAGVPRTALSLQGLDPQVLQRFPTLRQQLELVGCAACHTTDADFVQTRSNRTISPFYAKELDARARHLERLTLGEAPRPPFGPLQQSPVLPP